MRFTLAVCVLGTLVGSIIRYGLPPHDTTEAIRQIYLWQGFAAMGLIDAATIAMIRWHGKCYPRLTNPITIILALAIITHAIGAFLYAAGDYGSLAVYDVVVAALTLAQVVVFGWWSTSRHGRRDRRFHPRTPTVNFLGRAVALRNKSHKAHPR